MHSEQFCGGLGLDTLFPSQVMSGHHFSESEWSPSNFVRLHFCVQRQL